MYVGQYQLSWRWKHTRRLFIFLSVYLREEQIIQKQKKKGRVMYNSLFNQNHFFLTKTKIVDFSDVLMSEIYSSCIRS